MNPVPGWLAVARMDNTHREMGQLLPFLVTDTKTAVQFPVGCVVHAAHEAAHNADGQLFLPENAVVATEHAAQAHIAMTDASEVCDTKPADRNYMQTLAAAEAGKVCDAASGDITLISALKSVIDVAREGVSSRAAQANSAAGGETSEQEDHEAEDQRRLEWVTYQIDRHDAGPLVDEHLVNSLHKAYTVSRDCPPEASADVAGILVKAAIESALNRHGRSG